MKKRISLSLFLVALLVLVGAPSTFAAVKTYTGICVDDPAIVQSSGSQYSLCSELIARNCPTGQVTSKTETSRGFQIECVVSGGTSSAEVCDPKTASCPAGTIAPDGSVNTGNESGTSEVTYCDPAQGPCQPGTIAPNGSVNTGTTKDQSDAPKCDPKFGPCQPGTIAPDGSVNVGTQGAKCDPKLGPCQPGTIAPDGSTNKGTTGPTSGANDAGTTGPGAQTTGGTTGGSPIKLINPLGISGSTGLEQFLSNILDFVIRIGTIVVILMMVYVGFKFVSARGDPGEISKAREMLLWTVVGALILLGSKVIAGGIEATVKALSTGG
jgi:hypothetical protein